MIYKWITLLVLGAIALSSAACQSSESIAQGLNTAYSPPDGLAFSHVYLILMENKGYDYVVGKKEAPYINSLIDQYGLATNYHGVAHPSQPNYLALFSGSTQGITDDGAHTFDGKNLAD